MWMILVRTSTVHAGRSAECTVLFLSEFMHVLVELKFLHLPSTPEVNLTLPLPSEEHRYTSADLRLGHLTQTHECTLKSKVQALTFCMAPTGDKIAVIGGSTVNPVHDGCDDLKASAVAPQLSCLRH